MPTIPIGEWLPDQADFQNPGSSLVQNVLPRTTSSYGPWPSIAVICPTALTARCQGAYSMRDTSANVRLFFGDAAKLYRMTTVTGGPVDVSAVSGYSTSSTERWQMVLYGLRIIATNFTNAVQSYVEGTSSVFAPMITSGLTSLQARYVATVKDWVMVGNTTDSTNGAQPQRVQWCAIDDPTNFPIPGTAAAAAVQSDFQDLLGDNGWVQGIVSALGTCDGAVFQERAVTRVVYNGPPTIFAFTVAEGVRGCMAPGSITQVGALAYYLGEDGFYAFDGSSSKPISSQKVTRFFLTDVDLSLLDRVTATTDPTNQMVYWAYPGIGHDASGNCNRVLAYHWVLDRWTVTAPGDVNLEMLLRALSFGYTLEQLDSVNSSLDLLPASLDDRLWTGGRVSLGCMDTSHKLNSFAGTNLAPTVETSEVQINPKGRALVTMARPLVDGGSPSIVMGTRSRLGDTVNYSAAVAMDANGYCPVRGEGRYHRGRLTLAAGSAFTHIQGIEVPPENITETGYR